MFQPEASIQNFIQHHSQGWLVVQLPVKLKGQRKALTCNTVRVIDLRRYNLTLTFFCSCRAIGFCSKTSIRDYKTHKILNVLGEQLGNKGIND